MIISASGRPAVIYGHFSEERELAKSASGRPTVIYVDFLKGISFWEACSELALSVSGVLSANTVPLVGSARRA